MIEATGSCAGIENYSRYLTGRKPGEPPPTLFEYLPDNALRLRRRKPRDGAADRRDVSQATFAVRRRWPNMASACPPASTTARCASKNGKPCGRRPFVFLRRRRLGDAAHGGVFVEQVIRPTGLIDPPVEIRPARRAGGRSAGRSARSRAAGYRTLVTTLTKSMAEDLTEYLHETACACGICIPIRHDRRIEIIRDLRLGAFDVLVGINLLREGLDIPECGLVAILDADKEGFLRSELADPDDRPRRAQCGRQGVLYADRITGSMKGAMDETNRRRESRRTTTPSIGITPRRSSAASPTFSARSTSRITSPSIRLAKSHAIGHNFQAGIADLEKRMKDAAADLDFEEAARLRDEIQRLHASSSLGDGGAAPYPFPPRGARREGGIPRLSPPENPPTPTWARTTSAAARRARWGGRRRVTMGKPGTRAVKGNLK